ncbi:enoyl-CoA hydratase/isomerase family protein [Baekduia soli]|uniref:enoyl-CoA hydratase/isomerase family protein n=1 Tax=Baekduia soli TaxID=496014 RepID=UPI001652A500|nr:enoyl-CoA hydratase-related protein [Baekduia soli]
MTLRTGSELLGLEVDGGVATLTLNRPAARNALNMEVKAALARVLAELPRHPEVRALVLTGSGPAFSAGGDVKEFDPSRTGDQVLARHRWLLQSVYLPLVRLGLPTVAAVNGLAFGAGVSLMLSCDIAIASEDATFSLAFSRMGLVPDCGALWLLPRAVGPRRARELLLTARRFGAAEALELGLVERVVPAGELTGAAAELGAALARGPRGALAMTKRLLEQTGPVGYAEALEIEAQAVAVAMASAEHAEALDAFLGKRDADFAGLPSVEPVVPAGS